MKIYHNPRCSKSRQTLSLIKEKGVEVEIIEYLKLIPSEKELRSIIKLLGIKPEKLLRKGKTLPSFPYILLRSVWAFIRIYLLRLGFLDGVPGFVIALSNFEGTFYRYLKLRELHRENRSKH